MDSLEIGFFNRGSEQLIRLKGLFIKIFKAGIFNIKCLTIAFCLFECCETGSTV